MKNIIKTIIVFSAFALVIAGVKIWKKKPSLSNVEKSGPFSGSGINEIPSSKIVLPRDCFYKVVPSPYLNESARGVRVIKKFSYDASNDLATQEIEFKNQKFELSYKACVYEINFTVSPFEPSVSRIEAVDDLLALDIYTDIGHEKLGFFSNKLLALDEKKSEVSGDIDLNCKDTAACSVNFDANKLGLKLKGKSLEELRRQYAERAKGHSQQ